MMWKLAGLALAVFAATAHAQDNVPEPDDYRTENYRAPVPATLAGARVLTTAEAETIWRSGAGVFVDVMPRPPKPPNLPAGTVWRDRPRLNIPGTVWLPDTGYGRLAAATEDYLRRGIARATGGNDAAVARGLLPGRLLDVLERRQARVVLWLSQCGVVSDGYRRLGAGRLADGGIAPGAAD